MRAVTHLAPLLLEITLKNVDLDQLSASLQVLSASPAVSLLQQELKGKLAFFLFRQSAVTFLCSGLVLFLFQRRNNRRQSLRRAAVCGLLSVFLLALLVGGTMIYPYDSSAFTVPRYEGALAAAPWIISLAGEARDTVAAMSEQLEMMALNLEDVSRRLDQINLSADSGEVRVLHVSDIHNNPAAFDLIEKVTDSFQIDLIIDTGDLTDYGSELEVELAARLARLPVPYLFVPGNHDSAESIEMLRNEGAIMLGPEPIEIAGLLIAGLADPAAENQGARVAEESVLFRESMRVKEMLPLGKRLPDIFALHNPLMAEPFRGIMPLILCGHTHSAAINFDDESGTILINAGTTGASGVRGLLAPHKNPYSAVVLRFSPGGSGNLELTAADHISIEQLQDSFTLQRFYNNRAKDEQDTRMR